MKKIINDSKTKRLGNTFIFKDKYDDIMIDSLKNNEQFTMQLTYSIDEFFLLSRYLSIFSLPHKIYLMLYSLLVEQLKAKFKEIE